MATTEAKHRQELLRRIFWPTQIINRKKKALKNNGVTTGGCRVGERQRLIPRRQAPQQVRALGSHGGGRGPLVHLLRGDVVVEQRLPVLQGRRVWEAPDEVGVRVRVGRVGGQVAGQVVGCCRTTGERDSRGSVMSSEANDPFDHSSWVIWHLRLIND